MIHDEYVDKANHVMKLGLDKTEKNTIIDYMKNIVAYVEILDEVDINEEPMDSAEIKTQTLRKDEVKESYKVEEILKNSHSTKDGFFIVPNILE